MKTILQTTLTFIVLFSISLLLSSFTSESQEKSWETMYNEIKILQEFSKKVFDMTPITINQLLMIKKEFNNYKNK